MAVSRRSYQTAHLSIVIAWTLFSAAVLGIEQPVVRFAAATVAGLPILWALWTLALARVPAETMEERLREELRHRTTNGRYVRLTDELIALSRVAREMDRVADRVAGGDLVRDEAYRQLDRIEHRMKQRVEAMVELARR